MLTALVFLLIIGVAVTVHEFAHYLNARSVGVPVRAFSIGMGPVIWKRKGPETEWRLSLFPIGGYVDLPGMAPKVDDDGNLQHPDEGMARKSLPEKLWVLIGGVLANFLLAVLLIAVAVTVEPGFRTLTAGVQVDQFGARVESVQEGSVAQELGLLSGDSFLAINGIDNPDVIDVQNEVRSASELSIAIGRNGERIELERDWPPVGSEETPLLGITLTPIEMTDVSVGFPQALAESFLFSVKAVPEAIGSFVSGVGSLLAGSPNEDLAGPVGMVSMVNQATQIGLGPILMLAALINLSLAVFNLLPIPGLDGGRMLLATVVAIRRKPFRPGQEETIHFIGVMAVLGLIMLLTFNELGSIIRG